MIWTLYLKIYCRLENHVQGDWFSCWNIFIWKLNKTLTNNYMYYCGRIIFNLHGWLKRRSKNFKISQFCFTWTECKSQLGIDHTFCFWPNWNFNSYKVRRLLQLQISSQLIILHFKKSYFFLAVSTIKDILMNKFWCVLNFNFKVNYMMCELRLHTWPLQQHHQKL